MKVLFTTRIKSFWLEYRDAKRVPRKHKTTVTENGKSVKAVFECTRADVINQGNSLAITYTRKD
jgi:hypothetical protein